MKMRITLTFFAFRKTFGGMKSAGFVTAPYLINFDAGRNA